MVSLRYIRARSLNQIEKIIKLDVSNFAKAVLYSIYSILAEPTINIDFDDYEKYYNNLILDTMEENNESFIDVIKEYVKLPHTLEYTSRSKDQNIPIFVGCKSELEIPESDKIYFQNDLYNMYKLTDFVQNIQVEMLTEKGLDFFDIENIILYKKKIIECYKSIPTHCYRTKKSNNYGIHKLNHNVKNNVYTHKLTEIEKLTIKENIVDYLLGQIDVIYPVIPISKTSRLFIKKQTYTLGTEINNFQYKNRSYSV